jgi:RsiW-degrading membrane proteinase PrsW (M82 family)
MEVVQRAERLVVDERDAFRALTWGMLSPVPVLVIGLGADLVFQGVTGSPLPDWASTVISAPIVEEFFKAAGLIFLITRIKNGYCGFVMGFFAGAGFSIVENLLYFGAAAITGPSEGLAGGMISWSFMVILRTAQSSMSHGLGTALIGFCLGTALYHHREGRNRWFMVPLGYLGSVSLHAAWNGSVTVLDIISPEDDPLAFLFIIVFFVFVVLFFLIELSMLLVLRHFSIKSGLRALGGIKKTPGRRVPVIRS